MDLFKRNNAISLNSNYKNGALADIAITTHGSDFYFAICAAMTVSAIAFIGLSFMKPKRDRAFHYITAAVVWVAAIAYFTMGANLGFTPIEVEYRRNDPLVRGVYREIFYVRYIDWFITTPLLLTDLLLTAGMAWQEILWIILVDEIMIVTGLIGALTQSRYKWGYYTFGCVALLYILYVLVWEARRHSQALGNDVYKAFLFCGTLTSVLWTLYPVAWGVSEGGNVIAPDSEAVFYGVLDFLAKPVFGALLIWGHRNIDSSRLGMQIHGYDSDPQQSRMRSEKHHHNGGAAGAAHPDGHPEHTNGTNTATMSGVNPTNGHNSTTNPHTTV